MFFDKTLATLSLGCTNVRIYSSSITSTKKLNFFNFLAYASTLACAMLVYYMVGELILEKIIF